MPLPAETPGLSASALCVRPAQAQRRKQELLWLLEADRKTLELSLLTNGGERGKKNLTKSPLLAYKKLLYLAKLDILLAFIYEPKHPEGDYLPTLISHKKLTSARGARTAVQGLNSALRLHQGKSGLFVSSKKLLCAFHRTTSWPWSTPKTGDCTVRGALGIHGLTRYETDCCWICLRPEKPGICGYLRWVLFGFWLDIVCKHPVPKSAV